MDITIKELHLLDIRWKDVLPQHLVEWLEVFSGAHNVVKEIMFPAILSAVSGLIAAKAKLKMSEIEEELVNLFVIVLAPPGAGKSAALQAGIETPVVSLEETIDRPVTRSGVFLHLKTMTEGMGVFAKDEVHIILEKMVGNGQNKNIDKAQWSVHKGNTTKREYIAETGMSFFGLSQPDSFLDIYGNMAKKGNVEEFMVFCCSSLTC